MVAAGTADGHVGKHVGLTHFNEVWAIETGMLLASQPRIPLHQMVSFLARRHGQRGLRFLRVEVSELGVFGFKVLAQERSRLLLAQVQGQEHASVSIFSIGPQAQKERAGC